MTIKGRPGFCDTLRPTQSLAESIGLHGLRWSGWGQTAANATAKTRVKTYELWLKVRVRAYGRVWADCVGGYVYTRLKTTTRYGSYVWRMLRCP